jgi:hypothetical protein
MAENSGLDFSAQQDLSQFPFPISDDELLKKVTSPGIYIAVSYQIDANKRAIFITPHIGDISFTIANKIFYPFKEFLQQVDKITSELAETNLVGKAIKATADLAGLAMKYLGANPLNYTLGIGAWETVDPFTINLKLNFRYGIYNQYNALEEVYKPIMTLNAYNLPTRQPGLIMTGSLPHAGNAFMLFGKQLVNSFQDATKDVHGESYVLGTKLWSAVIFYGAVITNENNEKKIKKSPIISFTNLLCNSIATNLSTSKIDNTGYPIEGSASLSFTSQTLPTVQDFIGGNTGIDKIETLRPANI